MPAAGETHHLVRRGPEILYAKPSPNDNVADVAARDLPKELRERYWIGKAADAGIDAKTSTKFEVSVPWQIERADLGRNRNEPGDGFRYVFRSGTAGTGGRAEWFEVTEVFEGVDAKHVEAFMRLENGGRGYPGFDPRGFLGGLHVGMPTRAAQRRAADKVIAAVAGKLARSSYAGLWRTHGYGTLVVGLPAWCAPPPLDPLRAENVVDDFTTRVGIGLKPYKRQLRRRSCPFWRIVVIWSASLESMREWTRKARRDVYGDPAYNRMGYLAVRGGLIMMLVDVMVRANQDLTAGEGLRELTLHVALARTSKREKKQHLRLPPDVTEVARAFDELGESVRWNTWARIKWHALVRFLSVVCFVRTYGLGGLERWVIARLSPHRWIAHIALRRRAQRLYRASRARHSGIGVPAP